MKTTATNDSGHVAVPAESVDTRVDALLSALENNDLHCREALKVALSELKHLYGTGRTTQQAEVICTIMQAIAILTESAKERATLAKAGVK